MNKFRLMLLVIAVCIGVANLLAGETKINPSKLPKEVSAAFKAAYPNAVIKGASKEKEDGKWAYEVESMDGTTKRDLLYSADGKVLETEETVDISTVPGNPKAAIAKMYPKGSIVSAEKSVTDKGMQYEVHVKVGKKNTEVKFDADGKLIAKKAHEKDEDEKEEKKDKTGKDKDDDDDVSPR